MENPASFTELEDYLVRLEQQIEDQAMLLYRLTHKNNILQTEAESLKKELESKEKKISDLEKQIQVINLAVNLSSLPNKEQLKEETEHLIGFIDQCLQWLSDQNEAIR